MRILEMVQQLAHQARAQGGHAFLWPSSMPEASPPAADPQWRPAPDPTDGSLVQDPDFTLPTTAGPITWRLFWDSALRDTRTEWGFSRRSSWHLNLFSATYSGATTVTVMHDDGTDRVYEKQADNSYLVVGARNGDTLTFDAVNGWDEIRGDTGYKFHFPAASGTTTTLTYRETPHGLRITCSLWTTGMGEGWLAGMQEPAGRRVTFVYTGTLPVPEVIRVFDWGDRRHTFGYSGLANLLDARGPTGCLTQYRYNADRTIDRIIDPEAFTTSYSYDSAGRVLTRSVAGNLGRYTYLTDGGGVLNMGYTDPLGRTWTHLTSGGDPVGVIDPLGNRETYVYQDHQPRAFTNALGETTTYGFDAYGHLNLTIDPLGNTWTYLNDQYGNRLWEQNPLGYYTTYMYGDASLRQVSVVWDALGNRTSFTYLANGLPESVTDALGNRTTYAWSHLGVLTGEQNALGYSTTYLYDVWGDRTGMVDALGNRWTLGYDAIGRPAGTEDPLGNRTTTVYEGRGLVEVEIDALGNRTSYQWNAEGSRTRLTDALGNETDWVYDGANQVIAQVDALGRRTTSSYDQAGRQQDTQNALGYRNTTVYDRVGRPVATVDPLGYRTSTLYDLAGRPQAVIDARGDRTTTVYDAAGQIIARVDALGQRLTTGYNAVGQVLYEIDRLGWTRVTNHYDARGLLQAQQDAFGYYSTISYDATKQQVESVDPKGATVTTVYDRAGRTIAQVNTLGCRTSFVYDVAARQVARQDALGYLRTAVYDNASRVQAEVDPLGRRTTTLYDGLGQPIATIDALGRRTTTLYDAVGNTQAVRDALGSFTTFVYNVLNNQTAQIDARGSRTTTLYDARQQVSALQDPLGARTSALYDTLGNLSVRIDARGRASTYTVDALNRTTGQLYPDGTRVTYTFDAEDHLLTMADITGVTTSVYDRVGQETSITYPTAKCLTYSYDNAVRLRSGLLDPDGGLTTYLYDSERRFCIIANPFAERTTMLYDPLDRELQKTLADGSTLSHTYDPAGRQTVLEHRTASGSALAVWTATYDAVGNRLTVEELDATRVTCSFDAVHQLINEQRSGVNAYNTTYQYDRVANRQVKVDSGARTTYSYNAANELLLVQPPTGQPTTNSWDANGNLLVENTGGACTSYTWDDENRLTRTLFADASEETYRYSGDSKRQQKVTAGVPVNFVYDGETVLQEADGSLVTQAQYTGFPGQVGGLTSQRRTGASRFYGYDLQANIRLLVSAGGAITDSYVYKVLGEELAMSGSTVNPYRWIGLMGCYRDQANREYVEARLLDLTQARWLSRGSIELAAVLENAYLETPSETMLALRAVAPSPVPPLGPPPRILPRKYNYDKNCSELQKDWIEWAMNAPGGVCDRSVMLDDCIAKDDTCHDKLSKFFTTVTCFVDMCSLGKKLTFHCRGSLCTVAKLIVGEPCGIGVLPDNVYICTSDLWWQGQNPRYGTTKCAPLVCILAHELIHVCGKFGHKGCFACIGQVWGSCKNKQWPAVVGETSPAPTVRPRGS